MGASMCAHPCYASVYDSVDKPVFRVRCDETAPLQAFAFFEINDLYNQMERRQILLRQILSRDIRETWVLRRTNLAASHRLSRLGLG